MVRKQLFQKITHEINNNTRHIGHARFEDEVGHKPDKDLLDSNGRKRKKRPPPPPLLPKRFKSDGRKKSASGSSGRGGQKGGSSSSRKRPTKGHFNKQGVGPAFKKGAAARGRTTKVKTSGRGGRGKRR